MGTVILVGALTIAIATFGVLLLARRKAARPQTIEAHDGRTQPKPELTQHAAATRAVMSPVGVGKGKRGDAKKRATDINIGIDFGTSTTKVCLRENVGLDEDAKLYRVELDPGRGLLCPSLMVLGDGHAYFGGEAQARLGLSSCLPFPHLKVCLACEADGGRPLSDCRATCDGAGICRGVFAPPGEVHATELAACFIAWVMATARERVPQELGDPAHCSFTYNVGVPVGQLEGAPAVKERYLRVVRAAERISGRVRQRMRFEDAVTLAREALAAPLDDRLERDTIQLCAEAGAAMVPYFVCPDTAEGLYALVDIGAWTTDISIFRLTDLIGGDHAGDRTVEYYAACSYRGALNKVDEEVTAAINRASEAESTRGLRHSPSAVSVEQIRLCREAADYTGLERLGSRDARSLRALFDVSRRSLAGEILAAFKSVLKYAREKAPYQSHWMEMQHPTPGRPHTYASNERRGKIKVYVAGGGAAEGIVWSRIEEHDFARRPQLLQPLGLTPRLAPDVEIRFVVAEGLAFPKALWPTSFGPNAVPPFARPRRRPFLELDEIGFGK
jgi:hypothetical protein